MNIIQGLTQEDVERGVMNELTQQILQIFRDNGISVAEARTICENMLSTMERMPLK